MDLSTLVKQLDVLLDLYKAMQLRSEQNDLSDLPKPERQSLITRAIAAVHRISGPSSTYSQEVDRILKQNPPLHVHTSPIMGIVLALREDTASGYIQNLTEIVHADIFSDFLDMARHLLDNGYKDPAAVLAGSTLESHLKNLAIKNSIPTENAGKAKKASQLNVDLTKANVYNKLDEKNVTAWLDLRNKAAHGSYTEYNLDQVKLLVSSIQDFLSRIPA
jgi:hypothetical protein